MCGRLAKKGTVPTTTIRDFVANKGWPRPEFTGSALQSLSKKNNLDACQVMSYIANCKNQSVLQYFAHFWKKTKRYVVNKTPKKKKKKKRRRRKEEEDKAAETVQESCKQES